MSKIIEAWQQMQRESDPKQLSAFYTAIALTAFHLDEESGVEDSPSLEEIVNGLIQYDPLIKREAIEADDVLAQGREYLAIEPEEPLTVQVAKANQHLEHVLGLDPTEA